MAIKSFESSEYLPNDIPIVYFHKKYIHTQEYDRFIAFANDHFFIPFNLMHDQAVSLSQSPFGSILYLTQPTDKPSTFLKKVMDKLKKKGVKEVEIHLPPPIYKGFVSPQGYNEFGFKTVYSDLNQHIELNDTWEKSIHKMQKRKLSALYKDEFIFRKMEEHEFEVAYNFIAVCRKIQKLQVNILWDKLNKLRSALSGRYQCFGVFKNAEISATCIVVNVTTEIAYCYLPATNPVFRHQSPMVLLIAGIVQYYQDKQFQFLDLGVSSLNGKVQESLKLFKKRMGAHQTTKHTIKLFL